ncbi:MAG: chemotaxis protein CheW [Candidatus Methylomirabilales bacterium]
MLARRRTARQAAPAGAGRRCLLFRVAGGEYAVDVRALRRVVALAPGARGQVHLGEAAYPLLDLRAAFGLAPSGERGALALAVATPEGRAALVVDEAIGLGTLGAAETQPLPRVFDGVEREWFEGLARLGPRLVILLRPEGLLRSRAATPPGRARA